MKKQFIGGEYFYSPFIYIKRQRTDLNSFISNLYPEKYLFATMGGYFSLLTILKHININYSQTVLLPSFLCPTILYPFNKLKIQYRFYRVNEKLEIDINDIKNKCDKDTKAVLLINYFGRKPGVEVIEFIELIKKDGTKIIEDMVHNLFSYNIIGDYAFNSFRKYFPVDASTIISDEEIRVNKKKIYSSYFFNKIIGQYLRFLHFTFGLGPEKKFLKYFEKAELEYYRDFICDLNGYNRFIVSKFDIAEVIKTRNVIYNKLHNSLVKVALFKNDLVKESSVGLPVLLNERDRIRKALREKNIYCPIHWKLTNEIDRSEFEESWYLSSKILTIPTNQYMKQRDIDLLLESVKF